MKAFVLQKTPSLDFNPALKHAAQLEYILPSGDVNHFTPERTRKELAHRLGQVQESDFLVLSGDPELIALAFFYLSQRLKTIKLLKYDRLTRSYNARTHSL